jgi:hypothetical protein
MIWIILGFLIYSLIGTLICDRLGILYGSDDLLELIVDGILISFWPLTVLIHYIFEL